MGDFIQKNSLTDSFNNSAAGKRLYHCIPVAPEGDEIRSSLGYGSEIPKRIRDALGIDQAEKVPLVFASDHMSKALAFGLSYADGEILMNMSLEGTDAELAFVCNRDVTMPRERHGALYSFSASGFVDLIEGGAARQLVSDKPVPFNAAEKVMDVKGTDDLMRAGLQILSFKETFQEMRADKKFDALNSSSWKLFYEGIAEMIKDGRVIWENHARGINPHSVLAERLNIKLPNAKQQPRVRKPSVP
ncbi:MAG: hypothetical protein HY052_05995 [Proteobacteria bacterium]|nr:hypothetical protein [Pseudomonadota bacterium]